MTNPTGQSAPDHQGVDPPDLGVCTCLMDGMKCGYCQSRPDPMKEIDTSKLPLTITEDQLSVYIANTAHLVLFKLRKEMHAEINKQVDRLRIDHEKRWEQTREQLKDLVRLDAITPEEISR